MYKILIIGQAPPAKQQNIPYDSTLLYEMLSWVGISKEKAQDIFEFESISPSLRGIKNGQHLKPLKHEMQSHYECILKDKISKSYHVILLGKCAIDFLAKGNPFYSTYNNVSCLPHPSRRNYNLIMKNKSLIIETLKRGIK